MAKEAPRPEQRQNESEPSRPPPATESQQHQPVTHATAVGRAGANARHIAPARPPWCHRAAEPSEEAEA
eukprot:4506956-Lingulodinium_polyedra.AAC.1